MTTVIQWNYMLFQDINAYAGDWSWFDALMVFCANLLIFCWPLLLLVVWGVPVSWRRRPLQPGEAEVLQERRATVLWIAVACLVAYAINLLIEQFVFEPRPFVTHKVHLLVSHAADSAFPSDHTAWSFAVIGMLLFTFVPLLAWQPKQVPTSRLEQTSQADWRRKLMAFLVVAFVVGCSIGFARIFVGVHYPGDVLGGAIDGLIAAYIVTWLRRWLSRLTDIVLRFAQMLRIA